MGDSILIRHGIIVTMNRGGEIIEDGAVAIEDGLVVDVGVDDRVAKAFRAEIELDARKMAVLPGLIDAHVHTRPGRGMADNLSLDDWLYKYWYPTTSGIKREEVFNVAMLNYSEAVRSGTTCVNDMFIHMDACAEAAERVGIRAVLCCDSADESEHLCTLSDNENLVRQRHNSANGRVLTSVGIEQVRYTSIDNLLKVREIADRYRVGIHIHLNETLGEIEATKKRHGKRPLDLAYDVGILGPDCVAAHCVWLTNEEIRKIAQTGTNVSHNPISNAKLGSGICPVPDLLSVGINVALGHDDNDCNNKFDLFDSMKWAALIHRAQRIDASLMPAGLVLRMATSNGAKALGLADKIGSIERGRKADLILFNLKNLRLTPTFVGKYSNLVSNLIYAGNGDDVQTVVIDGRIVMQDRRLVNVNEEDVKESATKSIERLLDRINYSPIMNCGAPSNLLGS